MEAGVVEPAKSEWSRPIVPVVKKNGSLRFGVDYRRLSAITIPDISPLPPRHDCIDIQVEAKFS